MPLRPVDGVGPADAPAEYLLGLGEFVADLGYCLDGPAPSVCWCALDWFESRLIKPGGTGAALEGSI